ncbi:MAG: hypothetical protein IPP83_15990 [Flavobacteriales bacterium]|nr:hypothetical protein [Flavobacteriales bacterium]
MWSGRSIGSLTVQRGTVDGRVFYVGDDPFDLKIWVEAVSKALIGKPVRYIPTWIVRVMALAGDLFKALRIPFPMNSGRFKSMTSDYITPMDRTVAALGASPHTMADGIERTVQWYDDGSDRWQPGVKKDTRSMNGSIA